MPTTTTTLEVVQRGSSLVDKLPPELLTAICLLVACPTVVWCRLVCRRLRDIIDGSLELQYPIELMRDGMTDIHTPAPLPHFHGTTTAATPSTAPTPAYASAYAQTHPMRTLGARLAWHPDGDDTLGADPTAAPYPSPSSAERLARLRELRRAWKTLRWTRCVTVPMPGPCCAYELVGGVFCKTQPTARRRRRAPAGQAHHNGPVHPLLLPGFGQLGAGERIVPPVTGGAGWEEVEPDADAGVPHVHGSRSMYAAWLPSGRAGWLECTTVVRDDLGVPARDFAMDPSQDLMVLFKGGEDPGWPMAVVSPGVLELHIRTMSTNQTHPEARVPVLRAHVLFPVTSVFLQTVDDVVGIMYCVDPARPRITIWNWKTGQTVVDRTSSNLPPATWDFSFVHSRALFVTTGEGSGTLELFTFTCDAADTDADAASTLTHVARLRLPPIHPSVRVLSAGTHTGPFLAACPPNAPFVSSNEERIYVLTVQYVHPPTMDGPRTRPRMCVFLHHRTLGRYLAWGAALSKSVPIEVPWSEWGPTHARMVPHVGVFQWLRYVHGERVAMLLPASKAGTSTLQVLDFNIRRAGDDDDDDDDDDDKIHDGQDARCQEERNEDRAVHRSLAKATLERVYRPTRIVMPNIFVDVVESGLPYLDARRNVGGDYSGVMIDDERLVGLKYPAFLTGDMKEIDVFTM